MKPIQLELTPKLATATYLYFVASFSLPIVLTEECMKWLTVRQIKLVFKILFCCARHINSFIFFTILTSLELFYQYGEAWKIRNTEMTNYKLSPLYYFNFLLLTADLMKENTISFNFTVHLFLWKTKILYKIPNSWS